MIMQDIRDGTKNNRLLCRLGTSEQVILVQIKNGKEISELWIKKDGSYTVTTKTS